MMRMDHANWCVLSSYRPVERIACICAAYDSWPTQPSSLSLSLFSQRQALSLTSDLRDHSDLRASNPLQPFFFSGSNRTLLIPFPDLSAASSENWRALCVFCMECMVDLREKHAIIILYVCTSTDESLRNLNTLTSIGQMQVRVGLVPPACLHNTTWDMHI
jgi:hypothetical protein